MRAVGIKELKNKLSHYVRIVGSGETVLITDRDKVVAELVPPRPGRAMAVDDARLAESVRKGWISPGVGRSEGPPPRKPVAPLSELMDELGADREDR